MLKDVKKGPIITSTQELLSVKCEQNNFLGLKSDKRIIKHNQDQETVYEDLWILHFDSEKYLQLTCARISSIPSSKSSSSNLFLEFVSDPEEAGNDDPFT